MRRLSQTADQIIPFHVDDEGYERLVFGEVLIPGRPNVFGDFHTKESIRRFAYGFMINGFGLDVNHDNLDATHKFRIVESFIAREGDPDFVEGSWVVVSYILDDNMWNDILSGKLNGYSYEALVSFLPVEINVPDKRDFFGVTLPDLHDGHTHQFYARLDDNGRVVAGGTTVDNGHAHLISNHTFTDLSADLTHRHRFLLYEEYDDADDEAQA